MTFKRIIALVLCAFMLTALSSCGGGHDHDHTPSIPPVQDTYNAPLAQDATGSIFLGTWAVTAEKSMIEKITFNKEGTLQIRFGDSALGGVFFDENGKITMYISEQVIEGPYAIKDDTITIKTLDDVLVLTKV